MTNHLPPQPLNPLAAELPERTSLEARQERLQARHEAQALGNNQPKIKQLRYYGSNGGIRNQTKDVTTAEISKRKHLIGIPNVQAIHKYFQSRQDSFTKSMKNISQAIIRHPDILKNNLLVHFSRTLNLGEASVMRFCKHLGFKGFTDFKEYFIEEFFELPDETDSKEQVYKLDINSQTSPSEILTKVSNMFARVCLESKQHLAHRHNELIQVAERFLYAQKVLLCGDPHNHGFLTEVSQHFAQLGIICMVATDPYDLGSKVQLLGKNDLLICISASGLSAEIQRLFEVMQKAKTMTVAICCDPRSPISMMANVHLQTYGYYDRKYTISPDNIYCRISQYWVLECLTAVMESIDYIGLVEHRTSVTNAVDNIVQTPSEKPTFFL